MSTSPGFAMQRIGRFEIQAEIGRGGFGKVFRAFDPKVGRVVAIKVLESDSEPSNLARFRNEATAAGNLHHKNIVTIHEFAEENGVQYLVMEYLEGQDIQKVLKDRTPLTLLQKVTIMSEVAEGLQCAHSSGVLHRDVKPANIMLLADGGVKVMDFGIARLTRDNSTRLTQKGYLIGTVLYMAPEQLLDGEIDALCDIWSYGVIYYELLAGRNPFETGNIHSEMYKITHEDPPPLTSSQCPEALQLVIRRLLTRDRELRFQSFEDVQFETEPILIELRQQEAQRLLARAQELSSLGEWEAAQPVVRSILELDPQNREARALRERIQNEIHKRTVRPRVEALIRRGDEEAQRRRFTEAIDNFDSASKLDSTDQKVQARLQQLRAAKQRNDRARQLIADSTQELRNNRLTQALELASEALRADPEYPEAAQLLSEIQLELQEREKERNIQAGLHKARGLIAMESFEDAISLLTELAAENPDRSEIKDLTARTVGQRAERERRRRLAAGLESAKALLKNGELAESIRALESLNLEFSSDPELSDLLVYVRQELKTRERIKAVEAVKLEVAELSQSHRYDAALAALQNGLRLYPDELVLSRLLRSVLSSKQAYEKERALEEGFKRIRELRQRGAWEEALQVVSSLLVQNPNDPELLTHDRQLREERRKQEVAAAILRNVQSARGLLDQGRPSEAIALLQTALREYPDDAGLVDLLKHATDAAQKAEKSKYISAQLASAAEFERRQNWPGALDCIRSALEKYPELAELSSAEQRILAASARAELDSKIAQERAAIESDLQAGKWSAAFARIRNSLEVYPEEDVFRRLLEEGERRRNEEIARLVREAREGLMAGQVDEAEEALRTRLQPYAMEPAVRVFADELAFEKSRREEAKRRDAGKQRDVAAQLEAIGEHERNQNLPAALELARKALQKHLNSPELIAAQARIEASIQQLDRSRQIAEAVDNIERILKSGDWPTASPLIQKARGEYPDEPSFSRLWKEAQELKSQDLTTLHTKVRQLLSNGKVDAAESTLQAGQGRFSQEAEFKSLATEVAQQRVRNQERTRAEREKQQYIADQLARSAEFEARAEYSQAAELIRKALLRFPADPVLVRELQRLEEALQRADRERAISTEVKAIERRLDKESWDAGLVEIRKAERDFADEPVFPQLRKRAEEGRQAEIDGLVARARTHLAAGELEQAEGVLRKQLQRYAQEPAVIALASDVTLEKFSREREVYVRKQIAARRFDDAERAIQEIADRLPARTVILELQAILREAQQRERWEAIYREGQAEAERMFKAGMYDEAIERYASLLVDFPGDAKLEKALQAATKARDDQERQRRFEAEIRRLEELKSNGSAEEVRTAALVLLKAGENRQVREFLKWAEAAVTKTEPVALGGPDNLTQLLTVPALEMPEAPPPMKESAHQPSPAHGAPSKATMGWSLAGAAALCTVVAIWAIVHFSGTPLHVKPLSLEFTYQIGGASPSTQSLLLTGGGSAPEVHSNAGWLDGATDASRSNVTVHVDPGNLAPKTYQGELTILAGKNASERKVVNVKLIVRPPERRPTEIAANNPPDRTKPTQPPPPVTPPPASRSPRNAGSGEPLKPVPNETVAVQQPVRNPATAPPPPDVNQPSAASKTEPSQIQGCDQSGDLNQYGGRRQGTLQWNPEPGVTKVSIRGREASVGHVVGPLFPHWRVQITSPPNVKIRRVNCDDWEMVFEKPSDLEPVVIQWQVY